MLFHKINTRTVLFSFIIIILLEFTGGLVSFYTHFSSIFIIGFIRFTQGLLIILIFVLSDSLASIGLAKHQIIPGFKMGLIWSIAFGLIAAFVFGISFLIGINPLFMLRTSLPDMKLELIMFFLIGGIIGPVTEEIVFRGIIYGFLRRWGFVTALLLSILIFIVFHPIKGIPLTQIVGGFIFAVAYETTGYLLSPIIIHVLGNTVIFSISLMLN
ncbi:CPBP family intramembrane metalloprotease [Candidatus Magnetomoraceae bacterium gMMP-15]